MKAITIFAGALVALATTSVSAETYQVSVTNNLKEEFLAPVLITAASNDKEIFSGDYVTVEAEEQILTGNPSNLARRIGVAGGRSFIAQSKNNEHGPLLSPGSTITYEITTDEKELRILSMVAPTKSPDNYVTAVISLQGDSKLNTKNLVLYDVGHNEGRRTRETLDNKAAAKVVFIKK